MRDHLDLIADEVRLPMISVDPGSCNIGQLDGAGAPCGVVAAHTFAEIDEHIAQLVDWARRRRSVCRSRDTCGRSRRTTAWASSHAVRS